MRRPSSQALLTAIVLLLGVSLGRTVNASTIFLTDLARSREGPLADSGLSRNLALEDERLMLDLSESPFAQPFGADFSLALGPAVPSHTANLKREITDHLSSVPETGTVCLLGLGLLGLARGLRRKLRG
jgi:hypothetical protein